MENVAKASAEVGRTIRHEVFGQGQILRIDGESCFVAFESGETRRISLDHESLHSASRGDAAAPAAVRPPASSDSATIGELRALLEEAGVISPGHGLGRRWAGGTLKLIPGKIDTQPREVPIEVFFKKICAIRDRLRVLEQKLNAHEGLSPEDKLEFQDYITRSYGSLTTFNLLFADKADQFVGQKQD